MGRVRERLSCPSSSLPLLSHIPGPLSHSDAYITCILECRSPAAAVLGWTRFIADSGLHNSRAGWALVPLPWTSAVFLPISRSPETLWTFKVMTHAAWASGLPNFRHLACLRGSYPHQSNSPPAWHLRDFQQACHSDLV